MNGVTINGLHSLDDYGIWLQPKSIPVPEPKLSTVSVPGADGELDLSTALTDGNMRFENREFELDFAVIGDSADALIAAFMADVHGRTLPFSFDDDPEHVWRGRWAVSDREDFHGYTVLSCAVSAEPYRYEAEPTIVRKTVRLKNAAIRVLGNSSRFGTFSYHCIVQLVHDDSTINVTSGAVAFNGAPKTVTREATYGTVSITLSVEPSVLGEYTVFYLDIDGAGVYEPTAFTWEYSTDGGQTWLASSATKVGDEGTVVLENGRQWVIPTITVSEDMSVTFRNKTYQLYTGEQQISDIVLRDGENTMVFTGTGTVEIEYTKGVL